MKRFLIVATALVVALAAAGCSGSTVFGKKIKGSGVLQTRSVGVEAFHTLAATRGVHVIIAGSGDSLMIRADDNVLDYVVTQVKDGVLRIGIDEAINALHHAQVEVTVPVNGGIRRLKASSAASIVSDELLVADGKMELGASSAGSVRVAVRARECVIRASSSGSVCTKLQADRCEVTASSSGRVRMKGNCTDCSMRAGSAGSIDAGEFTAQECQARASSAGSITVRCERTLDARASSAGSITYAGDAAAQATTSSGGSVTRM